MDFDRNRKTTTDRLSPAHPVPLRAQYHAREAIAGPLSSRLGRGRKSRQRLNRQKLASRLIQATHQPRLPTRGIPPVDDTLARRLVQLAHRDGRLVARRHEVALLDRRSRLPQRGSHARPNWLIVSSTPLGDTNRLNSRLGIRQRFPLLR
jgi:hypothetical protein